MKNYLHEVETAAKNIKPTIKPSPWLAENYIGSGESKLSYLNVKIPLVREVYKQGFSFSQFSSKEQWKIWDYIWTHSTIFEVMLFSSYWASSRPIEELFANRKSLIRWLNRVDNWAHSDEMSSHFSKLFEYNPKIMLPVFKKWSASNKPWLKRQSLVGLLYYSRMRTNVPEFSTVLSFIKAHMDDNHYYVQKGVGWTLRELWNIYPEKTYIYLEQNAHRIAPAAWTAATEKLTKKEKQQLIKKRRLKRAK
ncbi:MAG: DNA alkylation repair protein [Oligoflexia bacterium]|nr:DNA alkylation repair protein [Oligoflexia bacterium]